MQSMVDIDLDNPVANEQLCSTAWDAFVHGGAKLSVLPKLIDKIIQVQAWKVRAVRGRIVEFRNLRELIESKVSDGGWGEDPRKIEALIKDNASVLAMFREAMKCQGHNQYTSKVDNVNPAPRDKGNGKAYTLSRLQRESPELFQAVCSGDLSANAAAIKAGFRKPSFSVQAADVDAAAVKMFGKVQDRLAVARAILAELSDEERKLL